MLQHCKAKASHFGCTFLQFATHSNEIAQSQLRRCFKKGKTIGAKPCSLSVTSEILQKKQRNPAHGMELSRKGIHENFFRESSIP
jgi:hypothetical protein